MADHEHPYSRVGILHNGYQCIINFLKAIFQDFTAAKNIGESMLTLLPQKLFGVDAVLDFLSCWQQ